MSDQLDPLDLSINVPNLSVDQLRLSALEDAIRCLEEVRTGTDFEVECWQAARTLKQAFDM